jgi:hypothetical protein
MSTSYPMKWTPSMAPTWPRQNPPLLAALNSASSTYHLELLNIIDGEVHVVEVLVDRVDHTPDTVHDHHF